MSLFKIFDVAGSGMAAQSVRLNTTASNLANANSVSSSEKTAYRAREPMFEAIRQNSMNAQAGSVIDGGDDATQGVRMVGITQSQQPIQARYEPGNPMANTDGYVFGSNVNPIDELVNMISASRSYQDNVEVMNTAKQLMMKTLQLGK